MYNYRIINEIKMLTISVVGVISIPMMAKYIVFNCDGKETPVVFPDFINHNEIALTPASKNCAPISAGFCSIVTGVMHAEGFSKGLALNSRPQDAELISRLLTGAVLPLSALTRADGAACPPE
jgi:hypothetical protein